MNERMSPFSGRLVFGALLVGLGALWTADNLGLADAESVLRWWPVLLIAYGLAKLTGAGFVRRPLAGGFAVVAGTLILASNLGLGHVGLGLLWPIGMILLGIQILRRGGTTNEPSGPMGDSSDYIRSVALMGGASTRSLSTSLRGAELSAFMGGVELDLREAKPADGRVVVDAFAFMGGIDIIVPPDWRLEIEATPVMGALQDERALAADREYKATLVVRGVVIIGGLVLRDSPGVRPPVRVGVVTRRRGGFGGGVRVGQVGVVDVRGSGVEGAEGIHEVRVGGPFGVVIRRQKTAGGTVREVRIGGDVPDVTVERGPETGAPGGTPDAGAPDAGTPPPIEPR